MFLFRALVVSVSLPLFPLAANPGAITGQIQDVTSAVIPGVGVTLRSERTGKTVLVKTDGMGRYDLRDLPGDDYTMKIEAPGFHSIIVKSLSLSDGELRVIPTFELSVSPTGCAGGPVLDYLRFLPLSSMDGYLGGRVRVDLGATVGNSPPVAEATVSLVCDDGRICGTTRTDSDGRYVFTSLSPQTYGLRFSHAGFYTKEETGYEVRNGREMSYYPVYLERCPLGYCFPKLRPKKPLVVCE
jgi:hypothetical protein